MKIPLIRSFETMKSELSPVEVAVLACLSAGKVSVANDKDREFTIVTKNSYVKSDEYEEDARSFLEKILTYHTDNMSVLHFILPVNIAINVTINMKVSISVFALKEALKELSK